MKQSNLIIAYIILLLNLVGCERSDKIKVLSQYKYEDNSSVLSENTHKKLGSWVKEGITCYGIIMVRDENNPPVRLKEVYAKVISIHSENIKMEALENVFINRTIECNKVNIKKGECWDEVDGELFKTREEAIRFIDDKYPGLRVKY